MLKKIIDAIRNHKARRDERHIMRLMDNESFMLNVMRMIEDKVPTSEEVAWNFSAEDIAYHFDVSDIAYEIDTDDIANNLNLDSQDIASYLEVSVIAENIELDYEILRDNLDLDEIREHVSSEVMTDVQSMKEDLVNQVVDEIICRLGGEL